MLGSVTTALLAWQVAQASPPASVFVYNFPEGSTAAEQLRAYLEAGSSPCFFYKPLAGDGGPSPGVDVLELNYSNETAAARQPGKRSLIFTPSPKCPNDANVQINPRWVLDLGGPHIWRVEGSALNPAALPEYARRIPREYRAEMIVDYLRGKFASGTEVPTCEGTCKWYQRWWVNNNVGRALAEGRAVSPRLRKLLRRGPADEEGSRQLAVASILSAYNSAGNEVKITGLGDGSILSQLCKNVSLRYAGPGISEELGAEWTLHCEQSNNHIAVMRLNEKDLVHYEERLPSKTCRGAQLNIPEKVGVALKTPDTSSVLTAFLYQELTSELEIVSLPSGCSVDQGDKPSVRRWTVRTTPVATPDWLDTLPSDKPLPSVFCVPEDKFHNLYQIGMDVKYQSSRARLAKIKVTGQYRDMPSFELVSRGQDCEILSPTEAECKLDGEGDPLGFVKGWLRIRAPFSICSG